MRLAFSTTTRCWPKSLAQSRPTNPFTLKFTYSHQLLSFVIGWALGSSLGFCTRCARCKFNRYVFLGRTKVNARNAMSVGTERERERKKEVLLIFFISIECTESVASFAKILTTCFKWPTDMIFFATAFVTKKKWVSFNRDNQSVRVMSWTFSHRKMLFRWHTNAEKRTI